MNYPQNPYDSNSHAQTMSTLMWICAVNAMLCAIGYVAFIPLLQTILSQAGPEITQSDRDAMQSVQYSIVPGILLSIGAVVVSIMAAARCKSRSGYAVIIVACVANLLLFPIGTVVGIIGLVKATKPEFATLFAENAPRQGPYVPPAESNPNDPPPTA